MYSYPVTMQTGGTIAQRDGNGNVEVAWTGSLADLMAADAYSSCGFSWWDGDWGRDVMQNDTYLAYLTQRMQQSETCCLSGVMQNTDGRLLDEASQPCVQLQHEQQRIQPDHMADAQRHMHGQLTAQGS